MKKPELLSPAGNLTKLKIAINYGADAVYASLGAFSLRQRSAKEFTPESFIEGVEYAHKRGVKFYATINGFPTNVQIPSIEKHIKFLSDIGVDAFIIASVGVMNLAKKIAPQIPIHVSTQANVLNYLDAEFYAQIGASRIITAREMNLKDATIIKEKFPNLELEIFVHGAMCFAYSGRCLISAVQSGRFSNRGSCANDCRFKYEIYAKNSENNTVFRLEERENDGTYIMNAKDLNLATHLDKIISTNAIDSLKIEGRTKSEYYVACTTNAYRMAIDDTMRGKFRAEIYESELNTLQSRDFTDGYLVKKPFERNDTQSLDFTMKDGTMTVCAISEDGEYISIKGKIIPGEMYEILTPSKNILPCDNELGKIFNKDGKNFIEFKKLINENGKEFSEIHSGNLNKIKLPTKLGEFSFLRKEIK